MKKVKQKYFNEEYWTGGTRSGYTPSCYNQEDYMNEAKASFLTQLYGGDGSWLEAGCAFGWVVEQLVEVGVDAYGFDISKHAIKNSPEELNGRVKCSDGLEIKLWEPGVFGKIVSFETAEHVCESDVDTWLSNLEFWLRPGGKLFLTICLGHDNIRGLEDNDLSHQTLQPREWWETKLLNCGLEIDQEAFDKAQEIEVYTEEMQIRGKREKIIQEYGLHIFAWEKPE